MTSKIKKLAQLRVALRLERAQGKRIVACCGSFDVLTSKHTDLLEDFQKQGDVLVVFLNSDSSVRSYKGPHRPIIPEAERASMLAALQSVDYVCLFDEINPLAIIDAVKPDVYCNGGDWGEIFLERDLIESYGGRVYSSAVSRKASTSDVIARIVALSKMPEVKAVFLDRDGIVIKDTGYLYKVEDVVLMEGIVALLKHFQRLGYLLIVVSNQSGIGRKMYTRKDVEKVNAHVVALLRKKSVTITDVFYCPHTPEYKCDCRKPNPGMLLNAAKKYDISLARSYVIGDKPSDIEAGKLVNCKTILFTAGAVPRASRERPHFVVHLMRDVQRIILR